MIVLAGLISMVLNFVFLNYVDKLEQIKCGCSNDWRREYIKVYSLITIVIVTTGLFLDVRKVLQNDIVLSIITLIQLGGFVYLYCLYTFTRDLKVGNCECSESWERKLMYNYSLVIIILYFLTLIMNIGVVFFVTSPRFERVCKELLKMKKGKSKSKI